jgi:hypothetical protein
LQDNNLPLPPQQISGHSGAPAHKKQKDTEFTLAQKQRFDSFVKTAANCGSACIWARLLTN